MIERFDYVHSPRGREALTERVGALLEENGKAATAGHCRAVARESARLAARWGLEQDRLYTAGMLHDVAAVLKPEDMMAYAKAAGWHVDRAEERYPFLLHQRISAVIAREDFEIHDDTILSAIACHTTLKADPSAEDMTLFLADKLFWDGKGEPPYLPEVRRALEHSLQAGARAYLDYVTEHGTLLMPHRWLLEARTWLHQAEE